jgi:cytochrome c oxidase subunit 1
MPIVKGLVGGAIGSGVGFGLVAAITAVAGGGPPEAEPAIAVAWLLGLVGWVLGVGVWDHWARPWFGRDLKPYTATGKARYFSFDTDHKVIGIQYLVSFLVIFVLAGLFAMIMRLELMNAGRDVMGAGTYNSIMSLHGIMMIAVAVAATMGAFGNYLVPLMIGADDMAYDKLNALSYWLVPPVVFLLIGSFVTGGFDAGWTGYPPLSVTNNIGQLFFALAFITLGLSSIIGAINFVATIKTMRAPGLSWSRLPIFVWSVFLTAVLAMIFTQFIAVAMLMVVLDRAVGMGFFDAAVGGSPILYQHIFWFYSHPAVYIMVLPAFGENPYSPIGGRLAG